MIKIMKGNIMSLVFYREHRGLRVGKLLLLLLALGLFSDESKEEGREKRFTERRKGGREGGREGAADSYATQRSKIMLVALLLLLLFYIDCKRMKCERFRMLYAFC